MTYRFSATVSKGGQHHNINGTVTNSASSHAALKIVSQIIEEQSFGDGDKIKITLSVIRGTDKNLIA